MCIILLAHRAHRDYPLIVAANRDETYTRPAAPAAFWADQPQIFGGRDLDKGGSWLALSRNGRIAAVTNFRNGKPGPAAPRSRGTLVSNFLSGNENPVSYLAKVQAESDLYGGFVLIAGDLDALYWFSDNGPGVEKIPPGVHGLSNHLLDTPWPKIRRSKLALEALLGAGEAELKAGLFELLADRDEAPDHELPDTGVGLQRERELSPVFISGQRYGTRASTVVLIDGEGRVRFIERSFGPGGQALGEVDQRFRLEINPSAVIAGQTAQA
ncbi:MAG: NRDE family protein [Burkholderiales bacterium]